MRTIYTTFLGAGRKPLLALLSPHYTNDITNCHN